MRNFDQDRAARAEAAAATVDTRTFTVCGESFVVRSSVKPDILAEFENITGDTPAAEVLSVIDRLIPELLEPSPNGGPSTSERWMAVRAQDEDPLTLDDMLDVTQWMVEQVTGRPTEPPAPSSVRGGSTGTPSTDGSSSPEDQEPQHSTSAPPSTPPMQS